MMPRVGETWEFLRPYSDFSSLYLIVGEWPRWVLLLDLERGSTTDYPTNNFESNSGLWRRHA